MKAFKILFLVPVFLLASNDGPKDFDIIPRTLNALVFFGILFYLLKDIAKNAYNQRIQGILSRLEAIEKRLKDSKNKKEQSLKNLEIAKSRATDLIEISKKEVEILKEKMLESAELDIKNIEKSFMEQKEFATRKMKKGVVREIIDEIFNDKSITLNQNELLDIVKKRIG